MPKSPFPQRQPPVRQRQLPTTPRQLPIPTQLKIRFQLQLAEPRLSHQAAPRLCQRLTCTLFPRVKDSIVSTSRVYCRQIFTFIFVSKERFAVRLQLVSRTGALEISSILCRILHIFLHGTSQHVSCLAELDKGAQPAVVSVASRQRTSAQLRDLADLGKLTLVA